MLAIYSCQFYDWIVRRILAFFWLRRLLLLILVGSPLDFTTLPLDSAVIRWTVKRVFYLIIDFVKITAIAVVALRYYISLHPWATGSINQTNRWFLLVLACGNGFVEVGFLTKVKNSLGLTTTLLLVTERMLKAWRRDEPSLTWLRQRLVRGQRRLLLPATESGLGGRRLMPRPWLGVHLGSAWVFSLLQLH